MIICQTTGIDASQNLNVKIRLINVLAVFSHCNCSFQCIVKHKCKVVVDSNLHFLQGNKNKKCNEKCLLKEI